MSVNRLEIRGISKSFPGVRALDNIDLTIKPGVVHAIVGENGAGKSTLMKCLFGIYKPDKGKILIDGSEAIIDSPGKALQLGIAMIHQELNGPRLPGRHRRTAARGAGARHRRRIL